MGIVAFAGILYGLKGEWADAAGERFDTAGSLLYAGALFGITFGASGLPAIRGIVITAGGIFMLVLFVQHQSRSLSPLLDIRLFAGNRVFAFSNLAALIHYSAVFAVTMLMSLYLQFVKGLSPQGAGLVLLVQPLVQATFSPLAGRLSDVRDAGRVASMGMMVTASGLAMLIFTHQDTPLSHIVIALFLAGFGYALFSSPNTNAIMNSVGKTHYGVASSITSTMRSVGMSMSMAVATVTISACVGREAITPDRFDALITAIRICLSVSTCLCCLGVLASLARGKVPGNAHR